jgi:hypothetical protein
LLYIFHTGKFLPLDQQLRGRLYYVYKLFINNNLKVKTGQNGAPCGVENTLAVPPQQWYYASAMDGENAGIFHIWSTARSEVLCGEAEPVIVLRDDWAARVDPESLCATCASKWLTIDELRDVHAVPLRRTASRSTTSRLLTPATADRH